MRNIKWMKTKALVTPFIVLFSLYPSSWFNARYERKRNDTNKYVIYKSDERRKKTMRKLKTVLSTSLQIKARTREHNEVTRQTMLINQNEIPSIWLCNRSMRVLFSTHRQIPHIHIHNKSITIFIFIFFSSFATKKCIYKKIKRDYYSPSLCQCKLADGCKEVLCTCMVHMWIVIFTFLTLFISYSFSCWHTGSEMYGVMFGIKWVLNEWAHVQI